MFTPNRKLVKKGLYKIGDPFWHCHSGIPVFTLQIAVKFNISLIIWGESSAEFGSKASYKDKVKFDKTYFLKVSSKVQSEEMLDDDTDFTEKDMCPFDIPSEKELQELGMNGIYMGDYYFWDGERQVEFLKEHYDWREDIGEVTYKGYKSVECIIPGAHDYAKYIKRGFGLATDHASLDVRASLMSREAVFEVIKQMDPKRPDILDYYLEITDFTEEEFEKILKDQRKGKAKNLP